MSSTNGHTYKIHGQFSTGAPACVNTNGYDDYRVDLADADPKTYFEAEFASEWEADIIAGILRSQYPGVRLSVCKHC